MATDSRYDRTSSPVIQRAIEEAAVDIGLRSYMLRVYNYMMAGLAITGVVSYFTASSPAMINLIFGTPLRWVVMLAPIGFVLLFAARINKMNSSTAQILFWVFAAVMGLSLSSIFLQFQLGSVARVFFITAGTFGAMSLYGYTTQRDLTGFGSFLFMGLIGIFIASIVNIFMASSALQFAISIIGVLVFTGLTAYDTQNIKLMYQQGIQRENQTKTAIMGALNLYLDFINLFIMLLNLLGERK